MLFRIKCIVETIPENDVPLICTCPNGMKSFFSCLTLWRARRMESDDAISISDNAVVDGGEDGCHTVVKMVRRVGVMIQRLTFWTFQHWQPRIQQFNCNFSPEHAERHKQYFMMTVKGGNKCGEKAMILYIRNKQRRYEEIGIIQMSKIKEMAGNILSLLLFH